ncbi:Ankyrin repeats (3 copies) [Caballeronia peredens]|nr:Ankyrin repeats (3 copies) [Caballeronia peredens]
MKRKSDEEPLSGDIYECRDEVSRQELISIREAIPIPRTPSLSIPIGFCVPFDTMTHNEFLKQYEDGKYKHIMEEMALSLAAQEGDLTTVMEKLQKHPDMKTDNALLMAALLGFLPVVECLVEHGADIGSAFDEATRHQHNHIMAWALDEGVDVRRNNDSALRWACDHANPQTLQLLYTHYEDAEAFRRIVWKWGSDEAVAWLKKKQLCEKLNQDLPKSSEIRTSRMKI